jgi:hypothetical protein
MIIFAWGAGHLFGFGRRTSDLGYIARCLSSTVRTCSLLTSSFSHRLRSSVTAVCKTSRRAEASVRMVSQLSYARSLSPVSAMTKEVMFMVITLSKFGYARGALIAPCGQGLACCPAI